jgi:hypothetical protein
MLSPVILPMREGLFDSGQVFKRAGWESMGEFGVIYLRWKSGSGPQLSIALHLAMEG